MAAYPDIGFEEGTVEVHVDPLLLSTARGGGTKARRLFAAKKREFRLVHRLFGAEKATLEAFYDANRLLTLQFTWPGTGATYTVIFADQSGLQLKPLQADVWEASVILREV